MPWEYKSMTKAPHQSATTNELDKLGMDEWEFVCIDRAEDWKLYWFKRPWKAMRQKAK